jgi:DNA-binding phage protein
MSTRKTAKTSPAASMPFRTADHLRTDAEIAAYVESMLADGDARAAPVALGGTTAAMKRAKEIMARYRNTLNVLAK